MFLFCFCNKKHIHHPHSESFHPRLVPIAFTTYISPSNTGTSISGPTVDTSAWSLLASNVATATAVAKLKIVAHSRKALRGGELVAKARFVRYEQGEKEDGALDVWGSEAAVGNRGDGNLRLHRADRAGAASRVLLDRLLSSFNLHTKMPHMISSSIRSICACVYIGWTIVGSYEGRKEVKTLNPLAPAP